MVRNEAGHATHRRMYRGVGGAILPKLLHHLVYSAVFSYLSVNVNESVVFCSDRIAFIAKAWGFYDKKSSV